MKPARRWQAVPWSVVALLAPACTLPPAEAQPQTQTQIQTQIQTEAEAEAQAPEAAEATAAAPPAPRAAAGRRPAMTVQLPSLPRFETRSQAVQAAQGSEPAPVPNRGLEYTTVQPAPKTSLTPTLIAPETTPDLSVAAGPGHLTQRDERFVSEPAAGARLLVPFSY